MSVGIAFSGGGIPAAIGAACAWNAIADVYPSLVESARRTETNLTISTMSGGSIGYGLWANANQRIHFPAYRSNVTLEELMERQLLESFPSDRSFYGYYMINPEPSRRTRWCDAEDEGRKITVGEFADKLRSLPFTHIFARPGKHVHWWTSLIGRIFDIVCVGHILGGSIPWISSFAFYDEIPPLPKRSKQGTLSPSSAKMLHHVHVDLSSGETIQSKESSSVLDTLSYTSAFWAAPLVMAGSIPFSLSNNLLLRANRSSFTGPSTKSGSVAVLDGGVIDTLGLIGLLRHQTEHIIAFYNNNIPLSELTSPIAYLFGVNTTTDSMNSLLGPKILQVFPSELYESVLANLTNDDIAVAQLREVEVLANQLGVEPYIVKTLLIFSNTRGNFILDDDRIVRRLSSNWPDSYAFSPPRLDANALCMLNDWKVRHHRELLEPILEMGLNSTEAEKAVEANVQSAYLSN